MWIVISFLASLDSCPFFHLPFRKKSNVFLEHITVQSRFVNDAIPTVTGIAIPCCIRRRYWWVIQWGRRRCVRNTSVVSVSHMIILAIVVADDEGLVIGRCWVIRAFGHV